MDDKDAELFSGVITGKLLQLDCVKNAASIMAYYSFMNEPNLMAFMHRCMDMGKRVALPYVAGKGEMIAVAYEYDSVMKSNVYGIPEPVLTNDTDIEQPDLVIVPGIAFDESLHRIGFGGGYYDRFLDGSAAKKIGVCFDYQVVKDIGPKGHDVPMDMIVTEKRVMGDTGCG